MPERVYVVGVGRTDFVIHRARPVLCETDGFISELRRWTRQLYPYVP